MGVPPHKSKRMESLTLPAKLNEEDVSLIPHKAFKLKRILKKYTDEFGDLEITIKKISKKRTASQNRYYWGVIVVSIMKFILSTKGEKWTKNRIHAINLEINGCTYDRELVMLPNSEGIYEEKEVLVANFKTTSQMNTKEFSDFVDKLESHWSAVECYWPEPQYDEANYITAFLK